MATRKRRIATKVTEQNVKNIEHTELLEHLNNLEPVNVLFDCRYCRMKFAVQTTLAYHENVHKQNGNALKIDLELDRKCKDCDELFTSENGVKSHKCTANKKLFECDVCHKRFIRKYHFDKHRATHKPSQYYKCGQCFELFEYLDDIRSHEVVHRWLNAVNESSLICRSANTESELEMASKSESEIELQTNARDDINEVNAPNQLNKQLSRSSRDNKMDFAGIDDEVNDNEVIKIVKSTDIAVKSNDVANLSQVALMSKAVQSTKKPHPRKNARQMKREPMAVNLADQNFGNNFFFHQFKRWILLVTYHSYRPNESKFGC